MIELTRTSDPYGTVVEPEREVDQVPASGHYIVTLGDGPGEPDNWTGPFGSAAYAQQFSERLGVADPTIEDVTADALAQVGSVVTYADVANPLREFVVVRVSTDPWSRFTVCATDTAEVLTVNMSQRNWKVVRR